MTGPPNVAGPGKTFPLSPPLSTGLSVIDLTVFKTSAVMCPRELGLVHKAPQGQRAIAVALALR